jgi:hypothetical protein
MRLKKSMGKVLDAQKQPDFSQEIYLQFVALASQKG